MGMDFEKCNHEMPVKLGVEGFNKKGGMIFKGRIIPLFMDYVIRET